MSTAPNASATGWRANAVGLSDVRTVQRDGREYLQFPLVPLTEMVLNYPERGTKEYLPAEHIRETGEMWEGTLLTYVHPENRKKTVQDPDAFMGDVIGAFHDAEVLDGGERLRGNGLIDVEKAESLGGYAAEIVELLRRGEEVSVSAGYMTMEDDMQSGSFDGEQYDLVQGPPLPDHIAVFPSSSEMQARCSPEDGCAAPRVNAYPDGQREHANMSETESDVPTTEEQRQMTNELSSMLAKLESSGVATDRQTKEIQRLRNVVDGLGQILERGGTDVNPALDTVVTEATAIAEDMKNETPDDEPATGEEKTNAACECTGVCRCNPSTSGSDETGESLLNMAAAPGSVNRNYGREKPGDDAEAYPASGRRAWERRQVGLDDAPDDDDVYPAGGRSAWEERQAKQRRDNADSEQSDAGSSRPAVTRSSFERRANAQSETEEKTWLNHEYPFTAKKAAKERQEREERRKELQEQKKRNEARAARSE